MQNEHLDAIAGNHDDPLPHRISHRLCQDNRCFPDGVFELSVGEATRLGQVVDGKFAGRGARKVRDEIQPGRGKHVAAAVRQSQSACKVDTNAARWAGGIFASRSSS
jgi:hypothetical protein